MVPAVRSAAGIVGPVNGRQFTTWRVRAVAWLLAALIGLAVAARAQNPVDVMRWNAHLGVPAKGDWG